MADVRGVVGDRLSLGAPVVGSEQSNLARPSERFVPMALSSFSEILHFALLECAGFFYRPMGFTYQLTLSGRNGGGAYN